MGMTEQDASTGRGTARNEKVDRIVEIAQARFDRFGFRKTTMGEIARDAGVSKKTLYQHFSSKESLFSSIMEKVARGIRRSLEREIKDEPDAARKLEKLLTIVLQRSEEYLRSRMASLFTPVESLAEQAFKRALRPLTAELIAQGLEQDLFGGVDPELSADLIGGIIGRGVEQLKQRPAEKVIPQVIQLALGGLKKGTTKAD
jgi:AcrR family transcriptional regulator